jgi:SAM-dependent methyltransferase
MSAPETGFTQIVRRVEQEAIARYTDRLQRFGEDARTLGWASRADQWARFAAAARATSFADRSLLDIGCGLGDFRVFLEEQGERFTSYAGVDINDALLDVARRRFADSRFERRNVVTEPFPEPVCDVALMLGLVNFRLTDLDNYAYAARAIDAGFAACREALVVDMLSDRRVPEYPAEDMVFYFDPARMLAMALERTPHVDVQHSYAPIPQREFMMVLRKGPR